MSAVPAVLAGELVAAADAPPEAADITASAISHAAEKINEQHRLAQSVADDAVGHAIECGKLLLEQQELLGYGNFGAWVEANCAFSLATADNYKRVARNPNALGKSRAIRQLYPSGRSPRRKVLLAPTAAEPPAPEPAPEPVAPTAPGEELAIERAIVILKTCDTADTRHRLERLKSADEKLKKARHSLKCAEVAQRNARASAIAAARKLQEAGW